MKATQKRDRGTPVSSTRPFRGISCSGIRMTLFGNHKASGSHVDEGTRTDGPEPRST